MTWLLPSPRRPGSSLKARKARTRRTPARPAVEMLEHRLAPVAGVLDPAFGTGGLATTDLIGGLTTTPADVALQPDGKVVVLNGTKSVPSLYGNNGIAVSRYLPGGSPDTSFGDNGSGTVVTNSIGGVPRLFLQGDKLLVLAGNSLLRYAADGHLDPTFHGNGQVTLLNGAETATLAGDKIFVASSHYSGFFGSAFDAWITVERYNAADGSLDPTFDGDGQVTIRFPDREYSNSRNLLHASAVTALPDGGVFVAGNTVFPTGDVYPNLALARLNADGSFDTSFDGDGMRFDRLDQDARVTAAVVLPGGDLALAGTLGSLFATKSGYLARYDAAGQRTATATLDYQALFPPGTSTTSAAVTALAVQPDGKLAVGGTVNGTFVLARYNPDATLTFDSLQLFAPPALPGAALHGEMAVQPDGKLVLTGTVAPDALVARFTPAGSPDPAFGNGGTTVTHVLGSLNNAASAVAVQPDGKALVLEKSAASAAVLRYRTDGSLDPAFGDAGRKVIPGGASYLALQPDGKIVTITLAATGQTSSVLLARLNPADGSFDLTFGQNGLSAQTVPAQVDSLAGLAVTSSGRLIAAGTGYQSNQTGILLIRFTAAGSLDATFDGDGAVLVSTDTYNPPTLNGLALLPDDRILVAATLLMSSAPPSQRICLVRLGTDGQPDPSFGTAGWATVPSFTTITSLAVAGDVAYVAGDGAVARFRPDGTPDPAFGTAGIASAVVPGLSTAALAVQADGKVLLLATPVTSRIPGLYPPQARFGLVRLTTAGTPDPAFGPSYDGTAIITTPLPAQVAALALTPDGQGILVAGSTSPDAVGDVLVARLLNLPDAPPSPAAPTALAISPDTGAPGDGLTNATNVTFSGTLDGPGLAVAVTLDGNPAGNATVTGTTFSIALTLAPGPHTLSSIASNAAGPSPAATLAVTVDQTPPTAALEQPATPRLTAVTALTVTFSEPVIALDFTYQDLALTRDGGSNLIDTTVTVTPLSATSFIVTLPVALTAAVGRYVLTLTAAGVRDLAGNPGTGTPAVSWTRALAVTTTADSGVGSLRQAILDANAHPGPDVIPFAIPGPGVHTITPTTALPALTETATLDATTQPGYAGTPLIEIDGSQAGTDVSGLTIQTDDCTVRGLAVNRFSASGILVAAGRHTLIAGNVLGADAAGTADRGNGGDGVRLADGVTGALIGGDLGNIIAFNRGNGITALGGRQNTVLNNAIHDNGALGIDLGGDGTDLPDSGDTDAGPNDRQNAPVLMAARLGQGGRLAGHLSSLPATTFTLSVYANTAADPGGFGEGEYPLGSVTVTTDASGTATFEVPLAAVPEQMRLLTATVTDPDGNTSEFSNAVRAHLHVTDVTPRGNLPATTDNLRFSFNGPVDPTSFAPADDLVLTGPSGRLSVSGYQWADPTTLVVYFPPPVDPGTYTVRLGPDVCDSAGFPLDQDFNGVAGEPARDEFTSSFTLPETGPRILASSPSGDVVGFVSDVVVTFNKAIQNGTLTRDDVRATDPRGTAITVGDPAPLGGNRFRITFAVQSATGTYHVLIGPNILGDNGLAMDQDQDHVGGEPAEDVFDASFTLIDVTGPRVTGLAPTHPVRPLLDHADITFSEAIAVSSFDAADVSVTGPAGAIAPVTVEPLGPVTFRIHFVPQSAEGTYTVRVGPGVHDLAGNPMDQNQDGFKGEPSDQFVGTVVIDATSPAITGTSLAGVQNAAVRAFEMTFNEDIDPATFVPGLLTVTGPTGKFTATTVQPLASNRFRVTLPAVLADGNFQGVLAAGVTDLAGNPLPAPYQFTFEQKLPNLAVTAASYPLECLPGQKIDVQWTVRNTGQGRAAGTWTDVVSLSPNAQGDSAVELARLSFSQPVDPGKSYTRAATVTVPAGGLGSRWLVLTTNAGGDLDEVERTNNTSVRQPPLLVTQRAYPDLVITAVTAPDTFGTGETAVISWTVTNIGTGATTAGAWFDAVYLSADATFDSSDVRLVQVRNPDFLAEGESYTQSAEVVVPDSVARGSYYVIASADATNAVQEFDRESNNTTVTAQPRALATPPPAFLTVTSVQVNGPLQPGVRPTATWTITNTGGTTITTGGGGDGWDDGLALSRDAVYQEGQDYWLGSHTFWHGLPLRPGQSYTSTGTAEQGLPEWEPGTYYLVVIPDTHFGAGSAYGQSTIGRDVGVAPLRIEYPVPDLKPVSLTAPPAALAGQSVRVDWVVKNAGPGSAPAGPWADEVYLSADATLDAGDTRLGSLTHTGPLAAGATYPATANWTVPGTVPDGTYFLLVKTDASGAVAEEDETNNVLAAAGPMTVSRVASDLQVTSATGPATGAAGDSVRVDWTVVNAGLKTTAVAGWTDAVYLSPGATLDPAQASLLGEFPHTGALAAQATYSWSESVPLPARTEGTFHLFVVLDARHDLYEPGGEDNNVAPLGPALRIVDDQPDLAVAALTAPDTAVAGRTITVDWRIDNVGTAAATPPWQDALYLSRDATLGPEDGDPLASFPHTGSLPAGAGDGPHSLTVTLPDGLNGTYYLILAADSGRAVYEKNSEDNNVARRALQVTDLVPDLHILSARTPDRARAGQFLTIDYTAVNEGQEAATGTWQDAVYLSADDQFDPATDRLCGAFEHRGPLDVGATYGPGLSPAWVRLPDRAEGTYRIFVVADYTGAVPERDGEANNVFLLPQPVTVALTPADLVVTGVLTPATAPAGALVSVTWTVANTGPLPTEVTDWQDGVYLSADGTFDPAGDVELGIVTHAGSLLPGQSYTASKDLLLRPHLEGPYQVYVVTDLRRQVFEGHAEDNNTTAAARPLAVTGNHANLQVTALAMPPSALAGSPVTVSWTVSNTGRDATLADSWTDSVYLSADGSLDASDVFLARYPHNGRLLAGSGYATSRALSLPPNATGLQYIIVRTDSNGRNDVYEYKAEDDNTAAAAIQVDLVPPIDLQVTAVTVPAAAWSGQNLHLEWTVTNTGGTAAEGWFGGWYDGVYLSRDTYLDRDTDISLGSVLHSGRLAPNGASYTASYDARLPRGLTGPYYVLVATDNTDRVSERGAEDNNTYAPPPVLQVNLPPPADLAVTAVSPPPAALVGQPAVWSYTVINQGTDDAVGSWYDTLYLSADATWDAGDARVTRVLHQGDLARGASYTGTVTADCPAVTPGNYYLIARTDVLGQVREAPADRANNTAVAATPVAVDYPELPVGGPGTVGRLAAGQARYYRISSAPVGKSLALSLAGAAAPTAEVYVRASALPTRSEYDAASGQPGTAAARVVVPTTQAATYYVLVYGLRTPAAGANYTLRADVAPLAVTDTTYGRGGTAGNLTIQINGTGFDRTVTAALSDGASFRLPATAYYFTDGTRFYATFDLTQAAPGTYDLVVGNAEGAVEIVRRGLAVVPGGGGTNKPEINVPTLVRWGREFQFTVTWGNDGFNDALAPLLTVGGSQSFGLSPGDRSAGTRYTFLGTSTDGGPAGILRPGRRETMTFFTFADSQVGPFQFFVNREIKALQEPFEWDSVRNQIRPVDISDEEQERVFEQLISQVGTTNGDYLTMLARNATLLPAALGDNHSPARLLQLEVERAGRV